MNPRPAPGSFDAIAPVYDASREPPAPAVVERVADQLRSWEMGEIVDVGVGTGRWAGPLAGHGIRVAGLDASWGMLQRAQAKGLPRLVHGDAHRLPFRDRSVGGAFFAHVLHVLDRPAEALREACRVARAGAVALVQPRLPGGRDRFDDPALGPRRQVYDRLRRAGVSLPSREEGPLDKDRRILEAFPPDETVVVSDETVTEPLDRELRLLDVRGDRWTIGAPAPVFERVLEEVRRELAGRTATYRRVRSLARWSLPPAPLTATSRRPN
ncbi:MAG TPA: class I SAM-dependent methyltransferase [Thermoplasmata archaeon]|nr:class I SAM-dependent methyltransferase [Thermoplasmata archaeon]